MIKFETINGTFCRMVEPEPKPLLADAKVGDLCKTDLDEWIQIDDTFESLNPILYHFDRPFKGNLIHAEPLAPEGSAAWAWQMVMLGKTVYNPSYYYSSSHGLITPNMLGNCSKQSFVDWQEPSGWEIYKEPETDKEPIADCDNCKHRCTKSNIDYCQMYEPKPEPAKEQLEVGDWVKYDIDSYLQVIEPSGKERTLCRTLSGIMVYPYTSCLTKASHSEVVVPITISGTVRPAYNEDGTIDDEQFQLLPNGSWDGTEMFISFDAIDSHTRKLVESLLKAQEGETK